MFSSFEHLADDTEKLQPGDSTDRHCIVLKNPLQVALAIEYLQSGCSFQKAASVIMSRKEHTELALIGSCSDYTICKYAWFVSAVKLQKIVNLLNSVGIFAITKDMPTYNITSCLRFRIYLHHTDFGLINIHALTIPTFERHTSEVILDAFKTLIGIFTALTSISVKS